MSDCESSLCKMNGCMFPQACPRDRDDRPDGRERETERHIEELAKHTETLRHVRECLIAGGFDGITLAAFDEAFGFFVKSRLAPERGGEEETKP